MMLLFDLNVWLALIDERHVHHAAARGFWEAHPTGPFAFCRVTMLGFLRLATHPRAMNPPLSPEEAWDTFHRFLDLGHISCLDEPESLDSAFRRLTISPAFPRRLWTDAYLAAFAISGGHRIVSFDSDFTVFPGLDFLHLTPS